MRVLKAATVLLLAGLALALHLSRSPAVPSGVEMPLRAVDGVGITVQDLDRSVEFYTKVLFFEKVSNVEALAAGIRQRVVRLRLGGEFLELREHPDPKTMPGAFQHIAIVVNDIDQVDLWLRRHRVEHARPGAAGVRAFSFKDPDGYPLEIRQYPSGTGHPRWHFQSRSVFLGIDLEGHALEVRSQSATVRMP